MRKAHYTIHTKAKRIVLSLLLILFISCNKHEIPDGPTPGSDAKDEQLYQIQLVSKQDVELLNVYAIIKNGERVIYTSELKNNTIPVKLIPEQKTKVFVCSDKDILLKPDNNELEATCVDLSLCKRNSNSFCLVIGNNVAELDAADGLEDGVINIALSPLFADITVRDDIHSQCRQIFSPQKTSGIVRHTLCKFFPFVEDEQPVEAYNYSVMQLNDKGLYECKIPVVIAPNSVYEPVIEIGYSFKNTADSKYSYNGWFQLNPVKDFDIHGGQKYNLKLSLEYVLPEIRYTWRIDDTPSHNHAHEDRFKFKQPQYLSDYHISEHTWLAGSYSTKDGNSTMLWNDGGEVTNKLRFYSRPNYGSVSRIQWNEFERVIGIRCLNCNFVKYGYPHNEERNARLGWLYKNLNFHSPLLMCPNCGVTLGDITISEERESLACGTPRASFKKIAYTDEVDAIVVKIPSVSTIDGELFPVFMETNDDYAKDTCYVCLGKMGDRLFRPKSPSLYTYVGQPTMIPLNGSDSTGFRIIRGEDLISVSIKNGDMQILPKQSGIFQIEFYDTKTLEHLGYYAAIAVDAVIEVGIWDEVY